MAREFGTVVTTQGAALIAACAMSGQRLPIQYVAVGDGGGAAAPPSADQTALVRERWRGEIARAEIDPVTPNLIQVTALLDGTTEEFVIREMGLFTGDGVLLAVCDTPDTEVAGSASNVYDKLRMVMYLLVTDASTLDFRVNASLDAVTPEELTRILDEHDADQDAHPALQAAIEAARQAAEASLDSPGGCALVVSFPPGSAGQTWTVEGADEHYTGTIPEDRVATVIVRMCGTTYTASYEDGEGDTWSNSTITGPYFGWYSIVIARFTATLTVVTAAGAQVSATCGSQSYTTQADDSGQAVFTIGAAGEYTVVAQLDGLVANGSAAVTTSGSGYTVTLPELLEDLNSAAVTRYYREFEAEEWEDTSISRTVDLLDPVTGQPSGSYVETEPCFTLRIHRSEHGMDPVRETCMHTIYHRVGRNAGDYLTETSAATARTAIVNAMTAALAANEATPGTWPTASGGHIAMTWEQVQCLLLEGALLPAQDAASMATRKGFNWQNRDTLETAPTATLEQVLTAAYLPALGGVSTGFDALCTAECLQGLHLRHRAFEAEDGVAVGWYSLDGDLKDNTWGVAATQCRWDLDTDDLMVIAPEPYPGAVLAML